MAYEDNYLEPPDEYDPCELCRQKSCEGCKHYDEETGEVNIYIPDKFDIDDERYHQEFS